MDESIKSTFFIPDDIIISIISYFGDLESVMNAGYVCKQWRLCSNVNRVWEPIFRKRFPNKSEKVNFKIKCNFILLSLYKKMSLVYEIYTLYIIKSLCSLLEESYCSS